MKAAALIRFMLLGNRSWEEFAILLARISLGAFWAFGSDVEHNVLYVALTRHVKLLLPLSLCLGCNRERQRSNGRPRDRAPPIGRRSTSRLFHIFV